MTPLFIQTLKRTFIYKCYHRYNIKKINKGNKIRSEFFKIEGEEVLSAFVNLLNQANILFWLDFGTLLGYYRENDFIKHDNDLDVGTCIENADEIHDILIKNGFTLIHSYACSDGGREESYKFKHTCIDVFYYREDKNKNTLYCNTFTTHRYMFHNYRKKFKCSVKRIDFPNSGFVKAVFKGNDVYVPKLIKPYLAAVYGENFMIPDPNYDYRSIAKNITYYDYQQVQGTLVVYGKKY